MDHETVMNTEGKQKAETSELPQVTECNNAQGKVCFLNNHFIVDQ